jgi:hypothetical protein
MAAELILNVICAIVISHGQSTTLSLSALWPELLPEKQRPIGTKALLKTYF